MALESLRQKWGYMRIVKSFLACRLFSRKPFMLSHLITYQCNCTCPFCPWRFPEGEELSTREIKELYREASLLGFTLNFIWGGEPLLREDLPEVVASSNAWGLPATVFTNGSHLTEAHEFAEGAEAVIISLDAADEEHDRIRGEAGLFRRVLSGIDLLRRRYPRLDLIINSLLSSLNPGKIPGIMELAKELHLSVFFSTVWFNEEVCRDESGEPIRDLRKKPEELREDFLLIKEYKERGYPVNNSLHSINYFIRGGGSYRCYWPYVCLSVYPDGGVEDCLTKKPLANLRQMPLGELMTSPLFKEALYRVRGCRLSCSALDPIETAGVWEFRWDSLKNYHAVFRPR